MIRAVPIDRGNSFVRGRQEWGFERVDSSGAVYLYGKSAQGYEGWFERGQFGPPWSEPESSETVELVTVDLPLDVASALAEGILTETLGTPAGDVRALRADLEHERAQRELSEAVVRRIALSVIAQPEEPNRGAARD